MPNNDKLPGSLATKLIDMFGGVKQFNLGMAILGPGIINILQTQVENETAMIGTFQLGTGLVLFSGNSMFNKAGDTSMHSRMGMLTGGVKCLIGVSLIGIGLTQLLSKNDENNLGVSLLYFSYCLKTLSSVIDLFNTGVYFKELNKDKPEHSLKPD